MHHAIKTALRVMASMILVVTGAVALSTGAQAGGTDVQPGKAAAQTSDAGSLAGGPSVPNPAPAGDGFTSAYSSGGPTTMAYSCVSTRGAKVCFASYGDELWVEDTKADGHHAEGYLQGQDSNGEWAVWATCKNYKGAGEWKTCSYPNLIDEKEISRIRFRAIRREGLNVLNKSNWRYTCSTSSC